MDIFSFLKEHLIGHHYTWTNTALVRTAADGQPDRRFFDRQDGNQVLNMINFFGHSIGKLTIQDGRKLEELIHMQLPENVKSEVAVFNWLRGIYLYYWI